MSVIYSDNTKAELTNRVTTRELWLLGILLFENVADAVQQLDVTLLGVRLEC